MTVTCLVHRGRSSYVLIVACGHKMEDRKAAMAAHSSLHSVDTNAILQLHNKTLNTFVNIDKNTTLDDSCVIRVPNVYILADGNAVDWTMRLAYGKYVISYEFVSIVEEIVTGSTKCR
ncbi:hypothetical protein MTO96_051281 [Rhipicephalus appendiculatus]